MVKFVIAKYIRLSVEEAKTQGFSIETQRALLDKHIADMDIPGITVLEFVDDGHTGTNFERTAVQEMLELARQGKINCIIVKDFSRFGRNSIETTYYIDRVFPFYRVRFISVSDCFDSADHEGETGGLEVAFKFIAHEYYSYDLSGKIKAAKQEKMLSGEYVTKNCAFGYKLDDSRKMVIDESAAKVVRLIFSLAAGGKSLSEIEKRLYAEKHPTPGEYKKLQRGTLHSEPACIWNKVTIWHILRDEQYIGTYVSGKTVVHQVGSNRAVRTPKSKWMMIPNHHPAIIEKSVFDAVNARSSQKPEPLRKRKLTTKERYGGIHKSLLKGKVYCGCCNHFMRQSDTKNSKFHCGYTRSAPDAECHHLSIPAKELSDMLFEVIQKQIQVILGVEGLCDVGQIDAQAAKRHEYERQIAELNDEKRNLYEQLVLWEIDAGSYKAAKATLDEQLARLEQVYSAISSEIDRLSQGEIRHKQCRVLAQSALDEHTLTQRLVDLLIERVLIYPGKKIEVKWKVAGFFEAGQPSAISQAIMGVPA